MHPLIWFAIGLGAFLTLSFIGLPIAFSFAVVGFIGLIFTRGLEAGFNLSGIAPFTWASDVNLIAVPLFILMGQFTLHSGISTDLFAAAYKWIGRLPGGLAMATNLSATAFAACTGSALASGATFSSIAYPEMKRFNYDDRLATGCVAAGGTLGILIPPSITFIVYGFLTMTDVGKLFIAGILPGLLLSGLNLALIFTMTRRNPSLAPAGASFPWRERIISLRGVWGMLLLLLIVLGGLYLGVFAPSEAGAIGAFGAFVIALARRRLSPRALFAALKDSLQITCQVLTIIIGAMMFSAFVVSTGFTAFFGKWVATLAIPPLVFVIAILIIYIPLGMFIDAIPMIFLTVPIVFPVLKYLGVDPVWFGVLVVLMAQVAFISPPVGLVAFVVSGVTRVPVQDVFRGSMPFIIVMLVCVTILVAFPEIALFLPHLM